MISSGRDFGRSVLPLSPRLFPCPYPPFVRLCTCIVDQTSASYRLNLLHFAIGVVLKSNGNTLDCKQAVQMWFNMNITNCNLQYRNNMIQSTDVITRSNSWLYCIRHCENSARRWTRYYNHNNHPISRPHERAMGCLLWGFGRKLTALQRHRTVQFYNVDGEKNIYIYHSGTTEEGNCSYLLPRAAAAGSKRHKYETNTQTSLVWNRVFLGV